MGEEEEEAIEVEEGYDSKSNLGYESRFIGEVAIQDVPSVEPGEYCNGKKKLRDEDTQALQKDGDGNILFGGYCNQKAGWGTPHNGKGRCKHHGGDPEPDIKPDVKGPGKTHALSADPHNYVDKLPPEEEEFITNTTHAILDRIRQKTGRDPDYLDRVNARSLAIQMHILSKARDYTQQKLIQTIIMEGGDMVDEAGPLVDEVRKYFDSIVKNMDKMGVLIDPDEDGVSDLEQWRRFLEE